MLTMCDGTEFYGLFPMPLDAAFQVNYTMKGRAY